jgi:hypothetical protein
VVDGRWRISGWLTPWRVKWYSVAVLIGCGIGFVIGIASGEMAVTLSGRLGGDFPAFYSAGRLATSGEFEAVYDLQRMAKEQRHLLPDGAGVYPFAYPPHVAMIFGPLSRLPYRMAYTVYTLFMAGALLIAIVVIVRICEGTERYFYLLLALALTFYPMLRSIFGGQNSAASLLLLVLVWACVLRGREVVAGFCLGLLLFKPQFAIPLIGLFAVAGRWRTANIGLACGLVIFGTSYLLMGPALSKWLEFALWFSATDAGVNQANAISYLGFFEAVLGSTSPMAHLVGWTLTGASLALITVVWFLGRGKANLNIRIGVAVPLLVLIPPHVMYYDLSLAMVGVAAIGSYVKRKAELVGTLWLLGWSQLAATYLGFSPLFLVGFGLWVLSIYTVLPQMTVGWGIFSRFRWDPRL